MPRKLELMVKLIGRVYPEEAKTFEDYEDCQRLFKKACHGANCAKLSVAEQMHVRRLHDKHFPQEEEAKVANA